MLYWSVYLEDWNKGLYIKKGLMLYRSVYLEGWYIGLNIKKGQLQV